MSRESQWKALRALGIPELGCAAIMGNAEAESNCETNRVQGDFEITRSASRAYTQLVDDGAISREDFTRRGPGGGGYGWLQWTYPTRKAGYYDNAKALGVSIGSQEAAISWFWTEVHQPEYKKVLDAILTGTDLREISDVILTVFERPADMSEGARITRARMAQEILDEYGGKDPQPEPAPDPEPQPAAKADPVVRMLQACMAQDGYWPEDRIDGIKTGEFRSKIKEYAADVAAC